MDIKSLTTWNLQPKIPKPNRSSDCITKLKQDSSHQQNLDDFSKLGTLPGRILKNPLKLQVHYQGNRNTEIC